MTVEIPTVTEIVIIEPDGTVVEIAGNRGPQGVKGDKGDEGDPGPTGVVAATAPATYDSGTQTVGVTVGTTASTVAAGDDSRITGAAQKASNLTDLPDPAAARAALGLGSAALSATSAFDPAGAASAAQSYAAGLVDDLSGVTDAATARANLGLGTMATATASDYLSKAGNLSGIADAAVARTNLGLGTMATQAANAYAALTGAAFTGDITFGANAGIRLGYGGRLYDPDGTRTLLHANGNQLDALNEVGSIYLFQANASGFTANNGLLALSNASGGKPVVVRGHAAQTANLFEGQNSSTSVLASISAAGLLRWNTASNEQTTVGAAGGASALPGTPTKYLKVVDSTGATLVIPAYAAV